MTKLEKALSLRATKAQKSRGPKGRKAAALRAHATRAINAAKRAKGKDKTSLLAAAKARTQQADRLSA